MTTPLPLPQSDQPKVSPDNSTSSLPHPESSTASTASPYPPSTTSPAGSTQPQQPVAGPSRPNPQRPSLPNLNLPTNALNGFNALTGVNGLSGLNAAGANGDGQSLQERLASAQQQMQGAQQGMMGGTDPDGTPIIGGGQGATAEAMLRQLQAMQASRIRQGQQASLGFGQVNGSSMTAGSPANGGPTSTPSAQVESSKHQAALSPSSNGAVVNSTGTGPSLVAVQLTQAQKDMLAQHERLRNSSLSSSTGGSPSAPQTPTSAPISMPTPTNPQQRLPNPQASRAAIANQRQQFVQSLANYYRTNNMALPPEVFNGERDGAVKVMGVWVDLVDLFMTVMRSQGVLNAIKQPADSPTWANIIGGRGMPNSFPEPLQIPRPPNAPPNMPTAHTTNPVQYLVGVYIAFVKGFEDDMTRRRNFAAQNRAAPPGARPLPGQSPAAAMSPVATTPAQPTVATPANAPPTPINAQTPVTHTPITASATAPTPTTQTQTPLPSAPSNSIAPSSTPVSATAGPDQTPAGADPQSSISTQSNFPTPLAANRRAGVAAHMPSPIDTALASAASVPPENASATPLTGDKRKLGETSFPDAQKPMQAPTPKRPRYKVEYKPIHLPMTGLAGWDERAVISTFPNRNLAHVSHSIHDLAVVDMEAILMGLRSRLPREMAYAITALSMLSMPHPEDSLDGLPLAHLIDIFTELVFLLEEAAFGEDGYEAWEERMAKRTDQPKVDIADLGFMEWEQIGRHVDISLPDTVSETDSWRKDKTGGSTDIILSVLNLLRNFSLFEDNRQLMGRHPDLFSTLARIVDTRLVRVPGWSTTEEPYSYIEYGTIIRDVTMIITNVGRFCDLRDQSFANVEMIYRLIARTLRSGIELCNWKDSPYDPIFDPGYITTPAITTIYRAAEAFYSIAGSDVNREVLSRMPEADLVGLFDSMVKLLPVTQRQLSGLRMVDTHLVYFECLGLGLYSLAFLSPLTARAKMRAIPGACVVIRRIITDMMPRNRSFSHNPLNIICRRLAETLGVLNGTATCTGEGGVSRSMGFTATSGEGKGWRWASGTIESGWMAGEPERILECLMVHGVDKTMFAELDALWWADNE